MEEAGSSSCGVGGWRPACLQRFATSKIFIAVFGLLGTVQATAFVYFVATLTTLEKRFQMPSQTMGILMSGNEVSQIMLVLILSYLGGKGNRPRWMAWGVAVSALSNFILALPHFMYGAGSAALALTAEHLDVAVLNSSITSDKNPFTCNADRTSPECSAADLQRSLVPMILVFISQFVLGIGTALYFSVGQTYLDDNTKKTNTPMLLGVTLAFRTLGPACGFVLGSLCLTLYIEPSLTPLIERRDPRWLGAWWLGWVILGTLMLIFAFLIGMFPKNMPRRKEKLPEEMAVMQKNPIYKGRLVHPEEDNSLYSEFTRAELMRAEEKPLQDKQIVQKLPRPTDETFWPSLKRILTNRLLMVNNSVAVFYVLGASGYFTFFNKYTETQFNSSSAVSNMVAAVSTIFSLVAGFLISGFVISKYKPRTSYLLLWNIFVGCVYMSGELFIMSLSCPEGNFQANFTQAGILDPSAACNLDCACDSVRYSPVCHVSEKTTYFSACHAGCSTMDLNPLGKRSFSNCSCIGEASAVLTEGLCPVDCGASFYLFMGTVCFMQMLGCTGRITNILINYRSVLPQDKTMAQGLALMLISLFAFIPGPIVFGKIIDNACLIWDNTCGEKGNCWLYDKTTFRIYLNATAASFSAIAIVLDVVLWVLGRHVLLYEGAETLQTGLQSEKLQKRI